MGEFKEQFVVKSKSKKTKEKEGETEHKYSALMVSPAGLRLTLHSDEAIDLKLKDELELRAVKFQKGIKDK